MRILITNDDGILAPGIEALYQSIRNLGEVEVVAPETAQSAMGHAITVRAPMAVHRIHVNNVFYGWSVDGRPADCVKLAMVELLKQRPDFVLSGINAGCNTGINVLYSGTVAGAVEAAFFGVPSMAISLELSDEMDFHAAGRIARAVFQSYAESRPIAGTCLNVNIPALDRGLPRGVRCCPQSTVPMDDHYRSEVDERNRRLYWLDGRMPEEHSTNTDLAVMRGGYVAVTPLRFDMTDHAALARASNFTWPTSFSGT
ncbi:MAG: 5'/3'-nucleotidase SurE [Phycisphaerae bacterium]